MKGMRFFCGLMLLSGAAFAQEQKAALESPSVLASGIPAETAMPQTEPVTVQKEAAPAPKESHAAKSVSPKDTEALAQRQLEYFTAQAQDANAEISSVILGNITSWLWVYPDLKNADKALALKAELELRQGDYRRSIVSQLKHAYEYPDSNISFSVRSILNTTISRRMDRNMKTVLAEIAKGDRSSSKADRLAEFLKKMSSQAGAEFYDALVEEFDDFFSRYPNYAKADELLLDLGNMHQAKKNYYAAIMTYGIVSEVYENSPLRPRACRAAGDVYFMNLKNYEKATKAYQDLINKYPESPEISVAYAQMAEIAKIQKQYELAVDIYGKMIELYPGMDTAFDAYNAQALVYRKELKQPANAVDALDKLATMFKGERAIAALQEAAKIARSDAKDYTLEIAQLDRLVTENPDYKDTPAALYQTGLIYEKDLKNPDKAAQVYQQVIDRYPGNSVIKDARKRLDSLMKK